MLVFSDISWKLNKKFIWVKKMLKSMQTRNLQKLMGSILWKTNNRVQFFLQLNKQF